MNFFKKQTGSSNSIINKKDGKEMILIPGGEFVMGYGEYSQIVHIDSFYIDRYPVTNEEYKKFSDATHHQVPKHWTNGRIPRGKEKHPVGTINWYDAAAYAKWAGGRLSSSAEWEKAATWDDLNKKKRLFPWGDDFDSSKCYTSESGIRDSTPVGKYSPAGDSAYGIGDLAGNVSEWVDDSNAGSEYASFRNFRGSRGSSWTGDQSDAKGSVIAFSDPNDSAITSGFRIVMSAPH